MISVDSKFSNIDLEKVNSARGNKMLRVSIDLNGEFAQVEINQNDQDALRSIGSKKRVVQVERSAPKDELQIHELLNMEGARFNFLRSANTIIGRVQASRLKEIAEKEIVRKVVILED